MLNQKQQLSRRLLGSFGRQQLLEEETVVEHLTGIVGKCSLRRFADDILQRKPLHSGAFHKAIQIVHIRLEMFAVMALERLLAHHRSQVRESVP